MIDPLSADYLAGVLSGGAAFGALVYWLLMKGKALAMRHQPRPASAGLAMLPVTNLFGAGGHAPMATPIMEQARQYVDADSEPGVKWASDITFPVDVDGAIRRIAISAHQVRKFIALERPVRSRRMPDGSMSPGYRGAAETYKDLLLVARAYGWVIPVGNSGVVWAPEYRSIGLRVMRLRERNNVSLPPPGEGDDTE